MCQQQHFVFLQGPTFGTQHKPKLSSLEGHLLGLWGHFELPWDHACTSRPLKGDYFPGTPPLLHKLHLYQTAMGTKPNCSRDCSCPKRKRNSLSCMICSRPWEAGKEGWLSLPIVSSYSPNSSRLPEARSSSSPTSTYCPVLTLSPPPNPTQLGLQLLLLPRGSR